MEGMLEMEVVEMVEMEVVKVEDCLYILLLYRLDGKGSAGSDTVDKALADKFLG